MYKYLFFIIFFYACDDPTSSEIPPIYGDGGAVYNYNMELNSLNTGQYTDYATITWEPYHNYQDDFISYTVRDENETLLETDELSMTSYKLQLNPENFHRLYVDMNSNADTSTDSIKIFTRPVHPITEFSIVADSENWFTSLNWAVSNETESDFSHYNIYRGFGNHNLFTNLENCDCIINTINNQTVSSYIDSIDLIWGGEYYYLIEAVTTQGYSRPSIIKSNTSYLSHNPQIDTEHTYASNSEYNKIIINWINNLENEEKFYALEIWRSNSEDVDPFNHTQLVTITDYNKNNFEDYYLMGDGMIWYYKLRLIDIYGNTNESELIIGSSHP